MKDDDLTAGAEPGVEAGAASSPSAPSPSGIHADRDALRSILNSVPALSGNEDLREMAALRDSFLVQIPKQCLTEAVRTIWQELWSKAMAVLTPSQMHQLGRAFVFMARAHADQKRTNGDPYIVHTLSAALILGASALQGRLTRRWRGAAGRGGIGS